MTEALLILRGPHKGRWVAVAAPTLHLPLRSAPGRPLLPVSMEVITYHRVKLATEPGAKVNEFWWDEPTATATEMISELMKLIPDVPEEQP